MYRHFYLIWFDPNQIGNSRFSKQQAFSSLQSEIGVCTLLQASQCWHSYLTDRISDVGKYNCVWQLYLPNTKDS